MSKVETALGEELKKWVDANPNFANRLSSGKTEASDGNTDLRMEKPEITHDNVDILRDVLFKILQSGNKIAYHRGGKIMELYNQLGMLKRGEKIPDELHKEVGEMLTSFSSGKFDSVDNVADKRDEDDTMDGNMGGKEIPVELNGARPDGPPIGVGGPSGEVQPSGRGIDHGRRTDYFEANSVNPKEKVPFFKSKDPQKTTNNWTGNKKAIYVDDKYYDILEKEGSLAAGKYRKEVLKKRIDGAEDADGKQAFVFGAAAGGHRNKRSRRINEIRDKRKEDNGDKPGPTPPKPEPTPEDNNEQLKKLGEEIQKLKEELEVQSKTIEELREMIKELKKLIEENGNNKKDENGESDPADQKKENGGESDNAPSIPKPEVENNKEDKNQHVKDYKKYLEDNVKSPELNAVEKLRNRTALYAANKIDGVTYEDAEKARTLLESMPRWKRALVYGAIGITAAAGVGIVSLFAAPMLGVAAGTGIWSMFTTLPGLGLVGAKVAGGFLGHKIGRVIGDKFFGGKALERAKISAGYEKAMRALKNNARFADKYAADIDMDFESARLQSLVEKGYNRAKWMPAIASVASTAGFGALYHNWDAISSLFNTNNASNVTISPASAPATASMSTPSVPHPQVSSVPQSPVTSPPLHSPVTIQPPTSPTPQHIPSPSHIPSPPSPPVHAIPGTEFVYDVTSSGQGDQAINTIWEGIEHTLNEYPGWDGHGLTEADKLVAIDSIKDWLASDHVVHRYPGLLQAMGINSGDINNIKVGDTIDFRPFVEKVLGNPKDMTHILNHIREMGNAELADKMKHIFGYFVRKY